MKTPRPVLIAGGGIGGLSTAIALDRAGLEAHVLERSVIDQLPQVGEVRADELAMLLGGFDLAGVRRRKRYERHSA